MKILIALLLSNVTAIASLGIAGYLAIHGTDGWGWFLFIAAITSHSIESWKNDQSK